MMRIALSRPHMSGAEIARVAEAFASNFIAPAGPQLDAFEAAVSDYLGGGLHCVALSSGSAALHLGLRLVGVGRDDEVWVSSMTFAGGVFPILYQNARPVFFDLDPQDWSLDTDLIAEALERANRAGRLPKAIVPTELYGQSAAIERLEPLARRYGVALVVDSAESLGALGAGGRKCGTGGDAAILSFNGNKIITTSGGGMLVTSDHRIAEGARHLATQAREPAPHYQHETYGYNYRLSNICAAIGLGQLPVLDDRVAARRAVFARYAAALTRPGLSFQPEPEGYKSSRWLSVARFDPELLGTDRETVRLALAREGIESRPAWKPMHLQPLFKDARYVGAGFDTGLFDTGLCLPSGSDLSVPEQDEVIGCIETVLARLQARGAA